MSIKTTKHLPSAY